MGSILFHLDLPEFRVYAAWIHCLSPPNRVNTELWQAGLWRDFQVAAECGFIDNPGVPHEKSNLQ
jgi:hypothetical protein